MSDSLAMFFGAKKKPARKSPKRTSPKRTSPKRARTKFVMVNGRQRQLHKGVNGGTYYTSKGNKVYLNASQKRKASPKRSPKRRASPKRLSMRYGYGNGQPGLLDMMGPAGLR